MKKKQLLQQFFKMSKTLHGYVFIRKVHGENFYIFFLAKLDIVLK